MDSYHPSRIEQELKQEQEELKTIIGGSVLSFLTMIIPFIILL
jgi:hypothetical protein